MGILARTLLFLLGGTAAGTLPAAEPVGFAPGPVAPVPAPVGPQDLFAAFTINLTRFVTWPEASFARPDAPFLIGTYPRDPLNRPLDAAVAGEMVDRHPVQVLRIQSPDDLDRCQIVFLSRASGVRPGPVLARIAHRPILTISDWDGFLEMGGHFRFFTKGSKVGLQASAANLRASGLEARAQLLRLATAP